MKCQRRMSWKIYTIGYLHYGCLWFWYKYNPDHAVFVPWKTERQHSLPQESLPKMIALPATEPFPAFLANPRRSFSPETFRHQCGLSFGLPTVNARATFQVGLPHNRAIPGLPAGGFARRRARRPSFFSPRAIGRGSPCG